MLGTVIPMYNRRGTSKGTCGRTVDNIGIHKFAHVQFVKTNFLCQHTTQATVKILNHLLIKS